MNPRKRRTIARAIMAGIPSSELNSDTIRAFLEAEKNKLNICDAEVNTILEENNTVAPNIDETPATNEEPTTVIENNVVEVIDVTSNITDDNKLPAGLQVSFSMKNTKSQLLKAAKGLGLNVKSNMTKAKILNLIESV